MVATAVKFEKAVYLQVPLDLLEVMCSPMDILWEVMLETVQVVVDVKIAMEAVVIMEDTETAYLVEMEATVEDTMEGIMVMEVMMAEVGVIAEVGGTVVEEEMVVVEVKVQGNFSDRLPKI